MILSITELSLEQERDTGPPYGEKYTAQCTIENTLSVPWKYTLNLSIDPGCNPPPEVISETFRGFLRGRETTKHEVVLSGVFGLMTLHPKAIAKVATTRLMIFGETKEAVVEPKPRLR